MLDALILKLARRGVEQDLIDRLATLPSRERRVGHDQELVREGPRQSTCSLLMDGLAASYRLLANGRRQITAVLVPGDFLDLSCVLTQRQDYSVTTITDCHVAVLDHDLMRRLISSDSRLMRTLWQETVFEAAVAREWLVSMGRRSAKGQMAHLLCELMTRIWNVQRHHEAGFHFPLTQSELADVLGLSSVHVNRVLKELRGDGLVAWNGQHLAILNWNRLAELAEFSPTYLGIDASSPYAPQAASAADGEIVMRQAH